MKKNKLYTVNEWNQPAFMPKNKFEVGGPIISNNLDYRMRLLQSSVDNGRMVNYLSQKSTSGSSFGDFFNKAGDSIGGVMGGDKVNSGVGALLGGLGTAAGQIGGNLIGGGLESGAGNTIGKIGGSVGSALSTVNPILGGIVSVSSGLVGGFVNRAIGTQVDQEKLDAANTGTAAYNSFNSNASSFDGIQGPATQAGVQDAYRGGWFTKGDARRKNKELRRQREEAMQQAFRSVDNNVLNLQNDQMSNALANYSAFGGPIETTDMGAIDYGFMTDYLTQKKRENDMKSRANGIAPMPAFMPNSFAIGGDLQTNGGDFSDGLVTIGAGGSHEENPYDGVQLGQDENLVPNLVEEGETIFNDYVFSNRILADEATKQLFHLPKKKGITFADISKRLEKEIAEKPNDPISKSGFEKQMEMLEGQQERQKQEMEAERAKAAFEALSPEEQTALMQQRAEQEAMAQQAAMQEAAAQQQPTGQPTPEEAAIAQQQMAANGGKLFAPGGYLWDKFWSPVNEYSKKRGNIKGKYQIDKEWKGNIKELEDSAAYKAFTNYILNDATDEERMKYFQWIDANTGRDNKYITDGRLVDNWKDMYQSARTDGLYGIQHYTPEWQAAETTTEPSVVTTSSSTSTPRVFHAMVDDDDYIQGELDPKVVGVEVRREILPNGDTVIYHNRVKSTDDVGNGNGKDVAPTHRPEWLRYAGLFGPATGLGLMAAGVGRPDTAQLDAAIQGAGDMTTADWMPRGDFLTYKPIDPWRWTNPILANSRATDRAIVNNSGGNRGTAMAGLLANGYNTTIGLGEAGLKGEDANFDRRLKIAAHNADVHKSNQEEYGVTSRFNADAYNRARQANAQMRLQAAAQKADMDAGWYNSLYGNISGLFKGIGDIGTENYRMNRIAEMAARGDFGTATDETYGFGHVLKSGKKKSKGGKMNKKRGLTI